MAKPDDKDTFFSRQQSALPLSGGRYLGLEQPKIVGADPSPYPALPEGYPLADHPELPDDFTDKVDEPTSMSYGQDLTKLPGVSSPPEGSSSALQAPAESVVVPNPATTLSAFSNHRNLSKNPDGTWDAFVGRGMSREKLGTFESYVLALSAAEQALAARGDL